MKSVRGSVKGSQKSVAYQDGSRGNIGIDTIGGIEVMNALTDKNKLTVHLRSPKHIVAVTRVRAPVNKATDGNLRKAQGV